LPRLIAVQCRAALENARQVGAPRAGPEAALPRHEVTA
jgi:hypothetical protein